MQPDNELPQTLAYFILSKLRWRIISGDLQPGQALREMEIQSHYGSSRGPVRESLRLLLQNGLVEHQQRRGFRVREYSPEDIRNIYALRRTLEGMVVGDLEGRDLSDLVQVLDGRLQIMEVCFKNRDIDGYFLENSEYHQAIIDFTENKPIAQALHYVNEISLPVRYRLMGTSFPTRRSLNYHYEIRDHLDRGNIAGAKELTEEHIMATARRTPSASGCAKRRGKARGLPGSASGCAKRRGNGPSPEHGLRGLPLLGARPPGSAAFLGAGARPSSPRPVAPKHPRGQDARDPRRPVLPTRARALDLAQSPDFLFFVDIIVV